MGWSPMVLRDVVAESPRPSHIVCCGPEPMMHAVAELAKSAQILVRFRSNRRWPAESASALVASPRCAMPAAVGITGVPVSRALSSTRRPSNSNDHAPFSWAPCLASVKSCRIFVPARWSQALQVWSMSQASLSTDRALISPTDDELLERFVASRDDESFRDSSLGMARWFGGYACRSTGSEPMPKTPFRRHSWHWQRVQRAFGSELRSVVGCIRSPSAPVGGYARKQTDVTNRR